MAKKSEKKQDNPTAREVPDSVKPKGERKGEPMANVQITNNDLHGTESAVDEAAKSGH